MYNIKYFCLDFLMTNNVKPVTYSALDVLQLFPREDGNPTGPEVTPCRVALASNAQLWFLLRRLDHNITWRTGIDFNKEGSTGSWQLTFFTNILQLLQYKNHKPAISMFLHQSMIDDYLLFHSSLAIFQSQTPELIKHFFTE